MTALKAMRGGDTEGGDLIHSLLQDTAGTRLSRNRELLLTQ